MLLSYQTIGTPSDSPLVFLHGLGASSSQTTSAFHCLKNRFLIAPDMPGHGESQNFPTEELNFDGFADKVIELMDFLEIESTDLGGLSMGSGITLNVALRYPGRVRKIILLRPSWTHEKQPPHLKLVANTGQWIEELGPAQARNKLFADPDFQNLQTKNKPVADSIVGLFDRPMTTTSNAVLYKMWQDSPFTSPADLLEIDKPTMILTTGRDELHPQSTADLIATNLPRVIANETLPPRYHTPQSYAASLNTLVEDFLNDQGAHLRNPLPTHPSD